MIAQFVQNVWIESYDPTIEDSYRKQIEVDVSPVARLRGSLEIRANFAEQGRQCMLEMYDRLIPGRVRSSAHKFLD